MGAPGFGPPSGNALQQGAAPAVIRIAPKADFLAGAKASLAKFGERIEPAHANTR